MQIMRWVAILLASAVIAACFFPWVSLEQHNFTVEGFFSTNNNFGKPGLLHVVLCCIYIILLLVGRIWSMRVAFFVGAFNLAWAIRNYVLISACRGGICPEKHYALYIILLCSILTIVALLFTDINKRSNVR